MGRPKRVRFDTFHLYDKLHTKKTKMMSGVEMTTLYPIKETKQFYLSIEVWAYCASKFKAKKKGFSLNVDLPVIKNKKAVSFLNEHCWTDWVTKEISDNNSDFIEAAALLNRLFPDKEKVFFYELDSLIAAYNSGTFISYDDNGNVEGLSDEDVKQIKYYTHKYVRHLDVPELITAQKKWTNEKDKTLKEKYLTEYHNMERDYVYQHHNLTDIFIELGENAVCYPVAFSKGTADWSKEKFGKEVGYAKAGEIFFVQTADKIFFQIKRHF